jgi:xanthine dehydrogenase accessory factor
VYLEPHRRPPRLVVVSATDVARALRAHLQRLGYDAVMVEPRADRALPMDEPRVGSLNEVALHDNDAVVLTDHDAPYAASILAEAVRSRARFVGMMSSKRHVEQHLDAIRAMGLTDDEVGRVRAPVGLDIGGRSAEEIALSIAAGIVADDHGRDGGWLDR